MNNLDDKVDDEKFKIFDKVYNNGKLITKYHKKIILENPKLFQEYIKEIKNLITTIHLNGNNFYKIIEKGYEVFVIEILQKELLDCTIEKFIIDGGLKLFYFFIILIKRF
jgi:hypothetical protein